MSGRNNRIVRNRERNSVGNFGMIKIVACVLIILVVTLGIFVLLKKQDKKSSKTGRIPNAYSTISYEYFMLSSQDAIGVIDKKGNKIIDATYESIDIPNPSKDVFFCYPKDGECQILNQKGEKILTQYDEVEVIQSTGENREIEKYLLKYKKDNLYGLLDLEGNLVTEALYSEIVSLKDRPGSILVKKDNKFGILDSQGNLLVDTKYDGISADGYSSSQDLYAKTGYIVSEKGENGVNFGYIDYKGNTLLDVKYEALERALIYNTDDIYLIAMQKGKNGVFKNKKKLIDLNFQSIVYSNVFVVNKNGKYGFYNQDGKNILKPEYEKYTIAGNYISVEKNGETQLFDSNGNLVGTRSFTKMIETENPAYFIAEDENGFYSIISKDVKIDEKYVQVQYAFGNYFIITDETSKAGVINALTKEIEIQPEYDFILLIDGTNALQAIDGTKNQIDIYSKELDKTISMKDGIVENLENGYGICYSENDMKYFNQEGKVVENTEVYPNKKLYTVCQNDKWGFCNSDGNIIVECQYDFVTEFNPYGFAGIKKGGKWGVVDEEGNVMVEPSYELDTYYFPQFIGKYQLTQSEITYCEEIIV